VHNSPFLVKQRALKHHGLDLKLLLQNRLQTFLKHSLLKQILFSHQFKVVLVKTLNILEVLIFQTVII